MYNFFKTPCMWNIPKIIYTENANHTPPIAFVFIKMVRNVMTTVSRAGGVDLFPAGGGAEGSIVIDGKRLSSAVSVCIGIHTVVMRSHEPGARTFTRI